MEKVVFHMVGGEDEASYAKNSSHQRLVLKQVKSILNRCIGDLLRDINDILSATTNCVKVADLGCCSGPNTFLTAHHIIQSIDDQQEQPPVSIQYFLNDLVSNDFNLVFRGLPEFYRKLENPQNGCRPRPYGSCLIAAMPGSFYGKLFPDRSMHFFHSSYGLQLLSQVPTGLVTESGTLKNKGSIYCANTGPPNVHQAYLDQFTRDFTMFLRMRSQEMVHHGHLLLTFLCKDEEEVQGSHHLSLMGRALTEMVTEGLIEEEKLDRFNLPWYTPSVEETRHVIENEGSFKIQEIHTFKTRLDASCDDTTAAAAAAADDDDPVCRAKYVATFIRAVYEPVLASHFGEAAMDSLFQRFADKLVNNLQLGQGVTNTLVISLRKE